MKQSSAYFGFQLDMQTIMLPVVNFGVNTTQYEAIVLSFDQCPFIKSLANIEKFCNFT